MSTSVTRRSVISRDTSTGTVTLTSDACGFCPACLAGARDDCRTADSPCTETVELPGSWEAESLPAVASLLRSCDAVVHGGTVDAVIAVVGGDAEVRDLIDSALRRSGVAVRSGASATDGATGRVAADAIREQWADRTRFDIVVSLDGDLEAASLLVRRGGALVPGVAVVRQPRIPTIVQRELDILTPTDVCGTARREWVWSA